jgi:hypothetical protein
LPLATRRLADSDDPPHPAEEPIPAAPATASGVVRLLEDKQIED